MRRFFRGGVHPPAEKELTDRLKITPAPAPKTVKIPLSQHIGKPAKAVVKAGDRVLVGQKIAEADGAISASVFSSVAGTVTGIETLPTATGTAEHVVIENDFTDEETRLEPLAAPDRLSVIARMEEAGIVGMGGAGFPSAVKFGGMSADTLIINAAECEPYITCDSRVIVDYTDEFLRGVELMAMCVEAKETIIAIEDNKPEAIEALSGCGANVRVLPARYPQGSEKHIIKAVTGKVVPLGNLPSSVGVAVGNVSTALAVSRAVDKGITCHERAVTVTGRGITRPANLWVKTGTSFADLIEYCGGLTEDAVKLISGGPMMGFALQSPDVYVTKTSGCVLALSKDEAYATEPSACINCAKCAGVCPMNLMPMYMEANVAAGNLDEAVKYGLNACIECGSCAYVCPAARPLVQTFRAGKRELRGRKK